MTASTPPSSRKQVDYNAYLWNTAYHGTWAAILAQTQKSLIIAVSLFTVVTGLAWLFSNGGTRHAVISILAGLIALALLYVAVFLAHLGYLTPKKLLSEKQKQLLEERARFGAAISALEKRFIGESGDRVAAALDKLVDLLKAQKFADPVAGFYEAGVAELEPPELEELCRQLPKRQMANPFANIPGDAHYWMWLLQSSVERGVHLKTPKDIADYHKTVQAETERAEAAHEAVPEAEHVSQ